MIDETSVTATKVCRECGKELPLTKFYSNSQSPDGRGEVCYMCASSKGRRVKVKGQNPALAEFTPRQLIEELRARGYKGELTFTQIVKV